MLDGFAERMRSVLLRPVEGFRLVCEKPRMLEALLLVLCTIGLTLLYYFMVNSAAVSREIIVYYPNLSVAERTSIPNDFSSIGAYTFTRGFLLWVGGALVVNLIAQSLGGRSTITRMLVVAGYCTLPIIVLTVMALVPSSLIERYDATLYFYQSNNTTAFYFGAGSSPYYLVGRALVIAASVAPVFWWYYGVRAAQEFAPRTFTFPDSTVDVRAKNVKTGVAGPQTAQDRKYARNRALVTTAISFVAYLVVASEFSPIALI